VSGPYQEVLRAVCLKHLFCTY